VRVRGQRLVRLGGSRRASAVIVAVATPLMVLGCSWLMFGEGWIDVAANGRRAFRLGITFVFLWGMIATAQLMVVEGVNSGLRRD
jgi:hypothetical protein